MSDRDKYCPECDARRRWYHDTCPECGGALVDDLDEAGRAALHHHVLVLETADLGKLPLARMALDEAGIEFTINQSREEQAMVFVSERNADAARAILADLESADPNAGFPLAVTTEWLEELPPVDLFDASSHQSFGHVTDDLLEWLRSELAPDDPRVQELVVSHQTIDALVSAGGDETLIEILREGLGHRRAMTVRWTRR